MPKYPIQLLAGLLLTSNLVLAEQNALSRDDGAIKPGVIGVDEILALNTTMRSMVDTFVKPVNNRERRAQALYELMFHADKLALSYESSYTKTAIETVESGTGNCVSLSSVFVAMGRYAGLDVNFLDVQVPYSWQHESDIYYQLKHISATVKVSHSDYLGIEYKWIGTIEYARPRIIDDEVAFATFYSNRGIELLIQDKANEAMENLEQAIELDPENSNNWSNLGVAYRRLNKLDAAEQAYLKALKKDKSDLTALNNLAILYQMTARSHLADKYNKKLERYRRKNPYYLVKLAEDEIKSGDYSKALRYTKKAIRKYEEEHEFHYVAARIYAHQGKTEKAMESLALAEKYALSARNRNLYSRKLDLLRNLEQAHN
jgi:Flp pilus assembly protein TadD